MDYSDNNIGLAVANSGTPGHQLVGKDIFVSLLRSATRCMDGTMYPQPGSYDNGTHVFDFAFTDHMPNNSEIAPRLGSVLNRKPVCLTIDAVRIPEDKSVVSFSHENIQVSSIYLEKDTIVVRAYEGFGVTTECILSCDEKMACYNANLHGEIQDKADKSNLIFTPYEIKCFVLKDEI